ncbi:FAD-dependent oxidoreductase [Halorussus halobius]|uniref:FAD-dependent oxidoreductase n=1 Tax=Halorussus halobius TaxID=1710537 RepID=UPI001092612E|nr:FAD-dependent oxidoreductase [Halorussus halobius]
MESDYDVAVVGGGPAGCAAGVFAARYGLDVVVFDRGPSSLRRCAFLENYPGFPAGVDVETFYDLLHEHVAEAGCALASELVASVARGDSDSAFAVETQDGRRVTATRVVAATREAAPYLRPLDEGAMFETSDHGDEERERFDPDYADAGGQTPVEGLYVAAPAGELNAQAVVSAGHGARVARTLLADYRREQGYPDALADHWDWRRRAAELDGEWGDRDRWREWFDAQVPEDHPVSEDRLADLREADVDRRFDAYLTESAVEERAERGLERLVETLGPERILDAMDDERIRGYLGAE